MSYDVSLLDPVSKETILLENKHHMHGGTYAIGGTNEMWLNITSNYGPIYYSVLGEDGIHFLIGKSASETIPVLKEAISKLSDDCTENYWEANEGNAKKPLIQLLAFAQMRPDGIWSVFA